MARRCDNRKKRGFRKVSSAMGQRTKEMLRMFSQTWLNIVLVFMLLTASDADILWWQGQLISSEPVPDFFER